MIPEFITFRTSKSGFWYDISDKKIKNGCIYVYEISGENILNKKIGQWILNVYIEKNRSKAFVKAPVSENTGILDYQIRSKTIVFMQVPPENLKYYNYFYHPISIFKLEGAKINKERINSENEIPKYIKEDNFIKKTDKVKFEKYGDILKGEKLKDKMIVLIEKDYPCLLAYYFYLEVIVGVYLNNEQLTLDITDSTCEPSTCR